MAAESLPDLVLRVEPNDDVLLTCWLCHGLTHVPCELATTFYTPTGRATVGLHRGCYDRACVRIRELDGQASVYLTSDSQNASRSGSSHRKP